MNWPTGDVQLLLLTALSIGTIHMLVGTDLYVPCVARARRRDRTLRRTPDIATLRDAGL